MVKSLVIGGAGFIGFHLASSLANQGQEVVIMDNFARSEADILLNELISKSNVTFLKKDVTIPESFNELPTDFDYVYFLAAINGTKNFYERPHEVLKVGIKGMFNVLEWFTRQEKGKFLFSSSSEAYAGALNILGDKFPIPTPERIPLVVEDPSNPRWSYGLSKMAGEVILHSYAKACGVKNFCIIRYHNIYGPRMGHDHVIPEFAERVLKKETPFKIYGGNETRTFCYVDDAVMATQKVIESSETCGETIHIGRSDGEISIIDLAKKIFKIARLNPPIEILPAPLGSVSRRCPDTSKLKRLGFEAKVSLDEGLAKTVSWYADHLKPF